MIAVVRRWVAPAQARQGRIEAGFIMRGNDGKDTRDRPRRERRIPYGITDPAFLRISLGVVSYRL